MNIHIVLRTLVSAALAVMTSLILQPSAVRAQEETANGNYAPINGLEMYYEIYGSGDPLILIHGGLGGIVEFAALLPSLAESRQVIAVELQGHGHTADIDRPISYEALADDIAALIDYLGYESADVMGYSFGGGVALQTAIRHPEVVDQLVLVSTTFSHANLHPEFQQGMAAMSAESSGAMLETPMYGFYSSVAPNVEDWATLVGKMGDVLREDYDWSADVAQMTTPTLIVVGDSDMLNPSYAVELFALLGGGVAGGFAPPPNAQLAVLPGTIHFDILTRTDLLLPIVTRFLDGAG